MGYFRSSSGEWRRLDPVCTTFDDLVYLAIYGYYEDGGRYIVTTARIWKLYEENERLNSITTA